MSGGTEAHYSKLQMQVMRVQIKLTSIGLYSGRIDGILGPATRTALEKYQQQSSLTVNGRMTTETMNMLGIPAVN